MLTFSFICKKTTPDLNILQKLFHTTLAVIIIFLFEGFSITDKDKPFRKLKKVELSSEDLKEQSGIAESVLNNDLLYVQEDSGNANKIFGFNHNGQLKTSIDLPQSFNRDWEDIAVAPGPEKGISYIYLADIGNNFGLFKTFTIYRFKEKNYKNNYPEKDTINTIEKITFQYPEKPKDAEAIMVNPVTKDIYVVTKEKDKANVYVAAYPQKLKTLNTLTLFCTLPFSQITSAAISATGTEIIMRSTKNIWYWKIAPKSTVLQTLKKQPVSINFEDEPQGEGICFSKQINGFITSTEINKNKPVKPFFTFFVKADYK